MEPALLKRLFDGLVAGKLPLNASEAEICGFLSPAFSGDIGTESAADPKHGQKPLPAPLGPATQRDKTPVASAAALATQPPNPMEKINASAKNHERRMKKTQALAVDAPRGRPPLLDIEKRALVLAFLEEGYSRRLAAASVGVSTKTLVRALRRDPEFAVAVALAEVRSYERPLMTIQEAARRDWRAAAWLIAHLAQIEKQQDRSTSPWLGAARRPARPQCDRAAVTVQISDLGYPKLGGGARSSKRGGLISEAGPSEG